MKVLFATTNKSKIQHYVPYLKENGIDVISLNDLNINCDVLENGNTPVENAIIKAKAYNRLSGITTIATDDGLYLDNVPDDIQPKTHVRRVNGKRLNDKEMIDHYIELVNKYGNNGKLKGYFIKAVSIANGNYIYSMDYKTDRCFLNKQSKVIKEGYPLTSMQFISSFNKYKSELSDIESRTFKDNEQQQAFDFIIKTIKEIQHN